MPALEALLKGLAYQCVQGNIEKQITEVVYDSRKVVKGCLFICIEGAKFDAHSVADDVVKAGAAAIVVQKPVTVTDDQAAVIAVEDTRYAMACISAAYFGHPAEKLKTIGITGTKGKTTTTYLVKSILEHAGYRVGLVGTIETITGKRTIPSENTTPESYYLQEYFAEMVEAGCEVVVMEVSSQGLMMHRSAGFIFDYGIFTNIEPDHIGPNEHKDFEDYLHCKSLLFQQCRIGILNGDDQHLEQILKGHTCQVETFGLGRAADLRAVDLKLLKEDGRLGVSFRAEGILEMDVKAYFPGTFSVYNALAALAICRHFKVSQDGIRAALLQAKVKGRIEMIPVSDQFILMIDYAHNAMALKSLLETLREYEPGRLVCMFGCGGNRSKLRRFEMGEVSGHLADLTVITSDNPRMEEPLEIIADIVTGIEKTDGKYITIPDRKEAIAHVIHHGQPGDVIILAGKGHEDYQEIKGVKYPMDERELIREILEEEPETAQNDCM